MITYAVLALFSFCAVFALMPALNVAAAAAPSDVVIGTAVCTARTSIHLRSGPSTNYSRVGKLPGKASVSVYKVSGGWYYIQYSGKYAWASGSYLRYTPSSSQTAPPPPPAQDPPADVIGTAVCAVRSAMNLRSGPSASSTKTGMLPAKASVNVYQVSGSWYYIQYGGKYAWAYGSYLRYTPNGSTDTSPPVTPPATPPPSTDKYSVYPMAPADTLKGKIVFLDPGHGLMADGRSSGGAYAGYIERKYTLVFANLVKQNLENLGATVVMTRSGDADVDNILRMAAANKYALETIRKGETDEGNIRELDRLIGLMKDILSGAKPASAYFNTPYDYTYKRVINSDLAKVFAFEGASQKVSDDMLFMSIHTNATPEPVNESQNGTGVYYLDNNCPSSRNYYTQYAYTDKEAQFAKLLLDEVSTAGDFRKDGIGINDYFMLRECNIPCTDLEVAYHTNASDRAKLTNGDSQKRIANGITYAILEYFGK